MARGNKHLLSETTCLGLVQCLITLIIVLLSDNNVIAIINSAHVEMKRALVEVWLVCSGLYDWRTIHNFA